MVVAAGVLVLLGLALFAGGIATGATVLHWVCVGVCAAAGLLLVLARRRLADTAGRDLGRAAEAAPGRAADPEAPHGEPPVERVDAADVQVTAGLGDEVLVVDERPRYHLQGCSRLTGHPAVPLPLHEARADGFTPCAVCAPDRHLAERERTRRTSHDG